MERIVTITSIICALIAIVNSACPEGYPNCYECSKPEKNRIRRRDAEQDLKNKVSIHCSYPCTCDQTPPMCRDEQVNYIVDGCGCCLTCARPQGDMCDTIHRCDEERGLVCDWGPNISYEEADEKQLVGTCVAKDGKACRITDGDGGEVIIKDRFQYKPSCNRLCTCQNGVLTCTNLCPQENQRPDCKNATLVSINENICCKEWVCPNVIDMPLGDSPPPAPVTKPTTRIRYPSCELRTSDWTPCSRSCDVGESYRVTNDNAECDERKEVRLCMLRPCGHQDITIDGVCRPTTKVTEHVTIKWNGCFSVNAWRPKFCSMCKVNRCCTPNVDKTMTMDFYCPLKNVTITKNYMWIKNCKCHRSCAAYWPDQS